jgi:ABC-type uncharacterized transport system fused permease/ATPase subunit
MSSDPPAPPLKHASKKARHLSKEFLATVISLVTTALGVVLALAWNSALTALFAEIIASPGGKVIALFIYAITITTIGVIVIMSLTRLAERIDAEPVEFKYPMKPRGDAAEK